MPAATGPWRCPRCGGALRRLPAAGADNCREHGHWEERYCAECGLTLRNRPASNIWAAYDIDADNGNRLWRGVWFWSETLP